ncbi:apolipoprotein N-acyltransferase [Corynebacterium choanae]|uniref:Apolipoprotein N-acyltransferase n=1 Tax=Corynebacterium choanae TaxID=1862358 RepID=A0A3G6J624_9CORY|nr:apolipoprotein N-acyltransferase [Corynebacterium choanae]AZA13545.1 Apolipoprotein N-acyltransferase [Corynebacterium choanae]
MRGFAEGSLRLGLSAASGLLCYGAFAPAGQWLFAIVGMLLFTVALLPWGQLYPGWRIFAAVGVMQSLVMYLLLLPWIGELVGTMPFVALAVTESLYGIIVGMFAGIAARHRLLAPLGVAATWTAGEWARASWPFGGFAWGRLAWGQVESPLVILATLAGPALVSCMVVLIGATLANLFFALTKRGIYTNICYLLLPVLLAAVTVGINPRFSADNGNMTIAAVQGNVPRLGLDFNTQRRAVLANHVTETMRIDQPVDVVLWPENASDINPLTDQQAFADIVASAKHAGAPVLVGTITRDETGPHNTVIAINPDGTTGQRHDKKYLQPFGEWMPYRQLLRHVTDLVDLANDFVPGNGNGVITVEQALSHNPVAIGIATCYEVLFDQAIADAIQGGAEILAIPTNNATFGFSDMTYQQLAMSRLRAVETHRYVVIAATSGVSAIVSPTGEVMQETNIFQARHLIAEVGLSTQITTAVRYGQAIELLIVAGALGITAFAWHRCPRPVRTKRRKRAQN